MNVLDCRNPHMPFTEFYNEVLSDAVEMDKDFANYKSNEDFSSHHGKFSFMKFAFILTPATKTLGLYYDNRWEQTTTNQIPIQALVLSYINYLTRQ